MHVMDSKNAVDPDKGAADFMCIDSFWHAFHQHLRHLTQ